MRKDVAGQKIGIQMVSATDWLAFTSAVTVYVTLDAGTQAIGSVGSGACTHKGNGYHTYAPSQAETNGDHLAFTFIGTGAVPVTIQIYTDVSQDTEAIKLKTDNMATAEEIASATSDALLGDNELATVDEIAAQVLVAANADPIASNTKEVNDISIDGTGVSPSDPWGP